MTDPTPDWNALTAQAGNLLKQLFPICRSITGDGLRATLNILRKTSDFSLTEIPSGEKCYDWTVPDEWNVREAFVADSRGRRVIDFQANNVHLVNYSIPFEGTLTFDELVPHLHSLPDLPKAIPYRTTYYNRTWGFCLAHEQLLKLNININENYHVVVDSTLAPGSLTYGEALVPGDQRELKGGGSAQEYLISTYVCHPSLANDNLSGVVLWTLLLSELRKCNLRQSYRFVIAPETIGALAYISRNEASVRRLSGGFVVTTVAGPGSFGYKSTWCADSVIDRAVRLTFKEASLDYVEYPFDVNGSDERQYSSPGLRIPVGTICKDKYYEYPFYHTSLDNLDFISASDLIQTLKLYLLVIEKLEQNRTYRSLIPIGEPMLGKRGLYPQMGGAIRQSVASAESNPEHNYKVEAGNILYGNELDAIRWVLFLADGQTPLLDVAEQSGLPLKQLYEAAEKLTETGLLEEVSAAVR